MTTLRPFRCEDLFRYNNVNLDPLTETYNLAFYLMYLARLGFPAVLWWMCSIWKLGDCVLLLSIEVML